MSDSLAPEERRALLVGRSVGLELLAGLGATDAEYRAARARLTPFTDRLKALPEADLRLLASTVSRAIPAALEALLDEDPTIAGLVEAVSQHAEEQAKEAPPVALGWGAEGGLLALCVAASIVLANWGLKAKARLRIGGAKPAQFSLDLPGGAAPELMGLVHEIGDAVKAFGPGAVGAGGGTVGAGRRGAKSAVARPGDSSSEALQPAKRPKSKRSPQRQPAAPAPDHRASNDPEPMLPSTASAGVGHNSGETSAADTSDEPVTADPTAPATASQRTAERNEGTLPRSADYLPPMPYFSGGRVAALKRDRSLPWPLAQEAQHEVLQALFTPVMRRVSPWADLLDRRKIRDFLTAGSDVAGQTGYAVGLKRDDEQPEKKLFRIALRICLPHLIRAADMKRLADRFDEEAGRFFSIRTSLPIRSLWTGSARPLRIGSSLGARAGRTGAVAMLVQQANGQGATFAVTAGHLFADKQGNVLDNVDVWSPSILNEQDSGRPANGKLASACHFPTWRPGMDTKNLAGNEGDLALVRIVDAGFVPTPRERRDFSGVAMSGQIYRHHPEHTMVGLNVVKATAKSPQTGGITTAHNVVAIIQDDFTGDELVGAGLIEIRLDRSQGRDNLAMGDSGCCVCVDLGGLKPLGIIVAGARKSRNASVDSEVSTVAYVVPFHTHKLLRGKRVV